MAKHNKATFDVGRPSPDRERVGRFTLYLGVLLAPLAWILQLVIGFEVANRACFAPGIPEKTPMTVPPWLETALTTTNIVALIAAALAIAICLRSMRRTGTKRHPRGAGGMLNVGEGRTRFLAVFGLLTSVLFFVAIAFNTASLFLVPLCEQ